MIAKCCVRLFVEVRVSIVGLRVTFPALPNHAWEAIRLGLVQWEKASRTLDVMPSSGNLHLKCWSGRLWSLQPILRPNRRLMALVKICYREAV